MCKESLNELREAVEANSIDELKRKSREFIDYYIELQTRTDEKRLERLDTVKKNLEKVKRKLDEVNVIARKDHLTGAFNRKAFEEHLDKHLSHFRNQNIAVNLVSFDIDHFKKINDLFGHDAGDQVLKQLVTLMQSHFNGEQDLVVRMGGEEFQVLCPNRSLPTLAEEVQKFLDKVRALTIIHSDTQIKFTVSAGIAVLGDKESLEQWLKRADLALYSSKKSGRDKYTVAAAYNNLSVA